MVEQLIRNQQVVGSSPIFSSKFPSVLFIEGFFIGINANFVVFCLYILILKENSKKVNDFFPIKKHTPKEMCRKSASPRSLPHE